MIFEKSNKFNLSLYIYIHKILITKNMKIIFVCDFFEYYKII